MLKITKLFLVISLLISTMNFAYAETLPFKTDIKVNDYSAKITGTADSNEGTEVSVMVLRPEKDIFSVVEDASANKETLFNNNVVCVSQTYVDDEKGFEFTCNFDKKEKSGIYTLRIQVYGEKEVRESEFIFENSERIQVAQEAVKTDSFNELKSIIEEYATDLDISAGKEYIAFSDKEKDYVLNNVLDEKNDKKAEYISSVEEIGRVREMKALDKEGLKEYIGKGDVVGIGDSEIKEISDLTSLKQDLFVADLFKRIAKVETPAEIKTEILKALEEVNKPSSTGGSNGSGSSSKGNSSTGSFVVVGDYNANQNVNKDKPYVIETPDNEGFTDMENTPWAKEAVSVLYEKGIVNGRGENMFCPSESVKREEFLKMIIESLNIVGISEEGKTFTDVDSNAWYSHYVETGVGCGIITGVSETEFGIGQPIKREDMATMIYRAVKYAEVNLYEVSEVVFTDENEISEYAKEGVLALASAKVINGMEDGSFMPKKTATRAQAAVMLYNLLYR